MFYEPDSRRVIGEFGEGHLERMIEQIHEYSRENERFPAPIEKGTVPSNQYPDWSSKDAALLVEVKTGHSTRGVSLRLEQHDKFSQLLEGDLLRTQDPVFYALIYHSVKNPDGCLGDTLHQKLTKGNPNTYLLPRAVISGYFQAVKPVFNKSNKYHESTMSEYKAKKIFTFDETLWDCMGLDPSRFRVKQYPYLHLSMLQGIDLGRDVRAELDCGRDAMAQFLSYEPKTGERR